MEPRGTRASLATAGAVALSLVGWLALPPPASAQTAQPWIQAELTVQQVCVFDVPQADVLIDNQPAGTVGTGHPCLDLNPNGDDPPPFSLVPGTTIQAAGRELVVADVGITYADAATDAAWGWIQQGATVDVQFYDEAWMDPPEDTQTIVDEGDGRWSTTTSVDLLDDQGQVNAVVRDGDGDATYASREVRDPWIGANADEEHVILSSFPARAQADISVGGEQIGSLTLDGNGDAATEGDSLGGFDLRVGQTVAVTADGISDDLLLVDVTGRLDADADLIFGQAPPGSTVSAEIWDHTDWASTQASQNGAWSIDTFATWGYHLQRSDLGDLKVADDDGDSTMRNLPTPMAGFEVTFFQNTYGSDGWWGISGTSLPQNTPVAIDVAGTSFDCPNEGAVTDESGGFWCSDLPAPAIGQTVTVTAGELTHTLTVEPLTMDVLHVGGYPSGTADPGTDLLVVRDWDDGNGAWVTSGPDGAWAAPTLSADAGIEMQARIEDADGDRQTIDRRVPAPRIVVEPRSQVVSAEDFEPPAGQPNGEPYDGTLTVATPGEADCSLTVEFSDGWMNVALWPVDAENVSCGIAVGDTVTVQAGGTTKSLVVDPLMVTTVDADTVSGSASPGSNVELRADFWDVQAGMASATADENGAWSATEWGWDQEPADLGAADELRAWIVDDDGDLTQGRFVRETLAVDPDLDQVWGWGWPDGATLTVDGRPAMQMQTLCRANEAYWYSFLQPVQGPYEMRACDGPMTGYPAVFLDLTEQGVDLVPGDQVTVADASGRSRGLTVRDIKVLDVNEAESTVTGRSDVPVTPSLLTGLAMGFWELPAGDWHFVLTDHPYYPGPMPEGEAGVFRSIHPDDQGETVARWTAESAPNYVFEGFTAPVDMGGVVNVANPGKTIPLRFRLTRDGAPVLDLTQAAITAVSTTCPAGAVSDKLESYSSAKAPVLQNLGDGYYRYNWKTAKTFAKSCYLVSIDLGSFGAYPTEPTIFRFK